MTPTQLALWNDAADPDAVAGVHRRPRARAEPSTPGCRDAELPSLPRGELPTRRSDLRRLEARAARYVDDAHAPNTRRAYQHDWNAFVAWSSALEAMAKGPSSGAVPAELLSGVASWAGIRRSTGLGGNPSTPPAYCAGVCRRSSNIVLISTGAQLAVDREATGARSARGPGREVERTKLRATPQEDPSRVLDGRGGSL